MTGRILTFAGWIILVAVAAMIIRDAQQHPQTNMLSRVFSGFSRLISGAAA